MKKLVFYSWQSDLPNSSNRGFIHDALESAAAAIKADDTVEVEPVIDRDTQGVSGAPDIAATIFSKITAADVFVADVSIVVRDTSRSTPNPNVLLELGYALKALGHERIILVFNKAFGKLEELPFDLRMRRILGYDLPEGQPKGAERKTLEKHLDGAIRAALAHSVKTDEPPPIPAVAAIENQQPNRILVLRRALDETYQELDALQPTVHSKGGTIDELIQAISATQEPVAKFSKIAEIIAVMNDAEAALELYRWFGRIFEKYNLRENFSGTFSRADFDFFKFIGHELFVTFIAFLLRENRWELLGSILDEPIPMRYIPRDHGSGNAYWDYASDYALMLGDEARRRRRVCFQADLLNERHTTGGLAAIMPMNDFVSADYFLFLLGELRPDKTSEFLGWRPWSAIFLNSTPGFLRAAENKRVANQLLKILTLPDADEFRKRFFERAGRLNELFREGLWMNPIRGEDIQRFGTR